MKQEKNGEKTEERVTSSNSNSPASPAENTKQKKTKQNGEKQSFFSKLFKRECGTSPVNWKKRSEKFEAVKNI